MKDMKNRNEAQMEQINKLTNGAPYELWLNAGGVYVVMAQKIASIFAQAMQNIFEADRMSYQKTAC